MSTAHWRGLLLSASISCLRGPTWLKKKNLVVGVIFREVGRGGWRIASEISYPKPLNIGNEMVRHPSSKEDIFVPIRAPFHLGYY